MQKPSAGAGRFLRYVRRALAAASLQRRGRAERNLSAGCLPQTETAAKLAAFHSIRVNSQWRLIFRWDGSRGKAEGVYLDDHSYR
ncbi:MAG: type II toxin-antitoxin system RelE/ParE family toxin [Proteobacteria bacterium]|nr:type II toxin-antitoxin system RelE/ParE family toxin [Pseudomonadota bacterium]